MKNKKIILAGILGLVLCVGLATTLAYFTDNKTQTNTVVMGNVEIELTEPNFQNNTSDTYKISGVVPNQEIEKDPTISVAADSNDAYIRLALSFEGLSANQIDEVKQLIALNPGWKMVDDYVYFNEKVTAGQTETAFDTVTIPNWGNDAKNIEFKIVVKAEAVQADYFTPTFDAEYIVEWPGVTVE